MKKPFLIAITGKIGSGKSTVLQLLKKRGVAIIDCDAITRDLYNTGGKGALKIQTFFGDEFLDKKGNVDRKKLLKTLVKFPKKWAILTRIIHPTIIDELKRRIKIAKIQSDTIAVEIPVLNKKLAQIEFDELWVIDAPKTVRHNRIISRNMKKEELQAIEEVQKEIVFPDNAMVIKNTGSIQALEKKITIC
ncbi:MAG: dephospho-CoA kinase [Candidatus Gracilibacteria bacterium]